jgi:RING finger/CHY zinc finger protein 1
MADGEASPSPVPPVSASTGWQPLPGPYLGCAHYQRKVTLACVHPLCAGRFYGCRFCHDEEHDDGQSDVRLVHKFDRKGVPCVRCEACKEVQSPAQTCRACACTLGAYFCRVCVLYDDEGLDKKRIFHCDACGICRVGGSENFKHCDSCAMCVQIPKPGSPHHKCSRFSGNCAVCLEDIFTSRSAPTPLSNCTHTVHSTCLTAMLKGGIYRCPECQRSAVDMRTSWARLDFDLVVQPMPCDLRGKAVRIVCNDCSTPAQVPRHYSGLRCPGCGSWNTTQTSGGAIEATWPHHGYPVMPPLPPQPAVEIPRARMKALRDAAERETRTLLTDDRSHQPYLRERRTRIVHALTSFFEWIVECPAVTRAGPGVIQQVAQQALAGIMQALGAAAAVGEEDEDAEEFLDPEGADGEEEEAEDEAEEEESSGEDTPDSAFEDANAEDAEDEEHLVQFDEVAEGDGALLQWVVRRLVPITAFAAAASGENVATATAAMRPLREALGLAV